MVVVMVVYPTVFRNFVKTVKICATVIVVAVVMVVAIITVVVAVRVAVLVVVVSIVVSVVVVVVDTNYATTTIVMLDTIKRVDKVICAIIITISNNSITIVTL